VTSFRDAIAAGVVIFDGATGTNLQTIGLTADDFGSPFLEGCNELLNVTRPDVVRELHRSFLRVGVDVIETNTFGAFAIPLGEYGLQDRSYEIAAAGAVLAREAADEFVAQDGRARYVAGSIGPGTKFPTLGQVTYSELVDAYQVEAAGLIDVSLKRRTGHSLAEHGGMARDYPDVRANTVPAFALGDYEWMLAFEADDLSRIVDLMRHLRGSETRRHVREEVPFYTGARVGVGDLLDRLP